MEMHSQTNLFFSIEKQEISFQAVDIRLISLVLSFCFKVFQSYRRKYLD